MAYVVTNKEYSMSFVCENETQLHDQLSDYITYENGQNGHIITITDDQFSALQNCDKTFKWVNNAATFPDNDHTISFASKQDLDTYIKMLQDKIRSLLNDKYRADSTYKTQLEQYVSILNNLDTSSITYPLNSSLEKHLKNNGHTVLGYLQLV